MHYTVIIIWASFHLLSEVPISRISSAALRYTNPPKREQLLQYQHSKSLEFKMYEENSKAKGHNPLRAANIMGIIIPHLL